MYKVIDNLLSEEIAGRIENLVKNHLHYIYVAKTTGVDRTGYPEVTLTPDTVDHGQMCCSVFNIKNSQPAPFHSALGLLDQILQAVLKHCDGIELEKVYRCKVNLLFVDSGRKDHHHHVPHVDDDKDNTLAIVYYCNDTDGDTFVFNEFYKTDSLTLKERVSPKRNRALVFDANRYHASSSPKTGDNRFVVNFAVQTK